MRFAVNDVVDYYKRPDDREVEWTELDGATLDEVLANFQRACETSDELARGHELEEEVKRPGAGREPVDLRWIYLHMIEEYARHCGHADVLRELIDGTTGYQSGDRSLLDRERHARQGCVSASRTDEQSCR
jgi:hypothetical protein